MTSLLTVIGTRPQYIKYAAMHRELRAVYAETLVDTGQHYDRTLSGVFMDELELPAPDVQLEVGSGAPALQLAKMLTALHETIARVKPGVVLCFGDTTSTLAAALAAVKSGIPVVHIEGGERSFDAAEVRIPAASAPEESNRIATDHLSSLLITASERAFSNLISENVTAPVYFAGDIMYDLFLANLPRARQSSDILARHALEPGSFHLCTVHRARNTDDPARLGAIFEALGELDREVIIPLHPRTAKMLRTHNIDARVRNAERLTFIEPVGYADSIVLSSSAATVITDSGGVMREAYFAGVPSVCVDDATAWIDIVLAGWSTLAGADRDAILQGVVREHPEQHPDFFGDGQAVRRSVAAMRTIFP